MPDPLKSPDGLTVKDYESLFQDPGFAATRDDIIAHQNLKREQDHADATDGMTADDYDQLFADPSFTPEFRDYTHYKKLKGEKSTDTGKFIGAGLDALVDMGKKIGKGSVAHYKKLMEGPEAYPGLAVSMAEGIARGTVDLYSAVTPLTNKMKGLIADDSKADFAAKLRRDAPEKKWTEAEIEKGYGDYRNFRDFERFNTSRELNLWRSAVEGGNDTVLGTLASKLDATSEGAEETKAIAQGLVDPTIAEGMAQADITDLIPGAAVAKRVGKLATKKTVVKAATSASLGVLAAGEEATAAALGKLRNVAAKTGETIADHLALTDDAVDALKAATPGKVDRALGAMQRVAQAGADTTRAVERQLTEGPARAGLFRRIAQDEAVPQWLRASAKMAESLDPIAAVAAEGLKSTAHGAAIGAGIGAVGSLGDSDAIASGLFTGGVMGLGGRVVGEAKFHEQKLGQIREFESARWLASKSPEEISAIGRMKLGAEEAVMLQDAEKFFKAGANNVSVQYVGNAEMHNMGMSSARGAQILAGDRPTVLINTDVLNVPEKGKTVAATLHHEMWHAMARLEHPGKLADLRASVQKELFGRRAPDGSVIETGVFEKADLDGFRDQYRNRLEDHLRKEFDAQPAEMQRRQITEEVAAESFANFMGGRGVDYLAKSKFGRKLSDSLSSAKENTFLGVARRGLESMGVTFGAAGRPSDVFIDKSGKALTNNATVNEALRAYVAGYDRVTKRLEVDLDDEGSAGVTFDEKDLIGPNQGVIAKAFGNADVFAKNDKGELLVGPDGRNVLLNNSQVRKIEKARAEEVSKAVRFAPDSGDPRTVRSDRPGDAKEVFSGQTFSDAQLAAIDGIRGSLVTPAMKEYIRRVNDGLRANDGTQYLSTYNAATKDGRTYGSFRTTERTFVPIGWQVSKDKNFLVQTLDTTRVNAKIAKLAGGKKGFFEPWGGDVNAFSRDMHAYLENHQNGKGGATNLDPNLAVAERKRDSINAFFGVSGKAANPLAPDKANRKDSLIRSRRVDRMLSLIELPAKKFPVNYQHLKANFLPGPGGKLAAADTIRAQALDEIGQRMKYLPPMTSRGISGHLLDSIAKETKLSIEKAATLARSIPDAEFAQMLSTIQLTGLNGAKRAAETIAKRMKINAGLALAGAL